MSKEDATDLLVTAQLLRQGLYKPAWRYVPEDLDRRAWLGLWTRFRAR